MSLCRPAWLKQSVHIAQLEVAIQMSLATKAACFARHVDVTFGLASMASLARRPPMRPIAVDLSEIVYQT